MNQATDQASDDHSDRSLLSVEGDRAHAATDDTTAHTRPKLNQKPSWIGRPARDRTEEANAEVMKQKVVIRYHAAEVNPPVYITTSLSEPPWEISEMTAERDGHGHWNFHTIFEAEEGEYQYKFRLGPGEWWVCDEDQPTIDDEDGNRNNVLLVSKSLESMSHGQDIASTEHGSTRDHTRSDSGVVSDMHEDHHKMPLLKHETTFPGQVEDIPEGTIFSSSPSSPASERLYFEQHRPGSTHIEQQSQLETPSKTAVKRQSSTASSLPKVQEEEVEEELIMIVSEDEDIIDANTEPKEEKSKQQEHDQVHTRELEQETQRIATSSEPKSSAQPPVRTRSQLAELGEIFFGMVFAVVVGVVALVLYGTGLIRNHDVAKDGGAALGG